MKIQCYKLIPFFILLFSCSNREKADRIYINAKIWTGDSSQPWAETIALKNNTILFVGHDYLPYKGSQTIITDLQGKMVVPGFIDSHTHFLGGGFQLASVNLRQAKSKDSFIEIVKDFALNFPPSRWIMGGDWDHEAWGGE